MWGKHDDSHHHLHQQTSSYGPASNTPTYGGDSHAQQQTPSYGSTSNTPAYGGYTQTPPPTYGGQPPMHQTYAQATPSAPPQGPRYCSISIYGYDKLAFVSVPAPALDAIRTVIQTHWKKGIKSETPSSNNCLEMEFKQGFGDDPWFVTDKEEWVAARRMVNGILRVMYEIGWVLGMSVDVSKHRSDCDSLVFRWAGRGVELEWAMVAFSSEDKVRFIDVEAQCVDDMRTSITSISKIEKSEQILPGVHEYKVKDNVWFTTSNETKNLGRRIVLALLEGLENYGWTVYAPVIQKVGSTNESNELDVWHICKPKGWTRGAPLYHR